MTPLSNTAIVVIGRNEGDRLIACLASLKSYLPNIVYVDSASTDNSVKNAIDIGAHVVSLDMTKSFTAARARNAGLNVVVAQFNHVKFVQFVDGDCEVNANWLLQAVNFLEANEKVAVVCGRRREKYPNASVYNLLCDLEWETPLGETKACGGDALMRLSVLKALGGYKESLIAGEEPELCVRIRQSGYQVWRLDAEMTLHDVNMTDFKQWWKRTTRAGYAFAEGAHIHGLAPEYHWVAESKRSWRWGLFLPIAIVLLALLKPIWAILLLLAYPIQWLRLSLKSDQPFKQASLQAFFLIIGKFAEMCGQVKFLIHRFTNKQSKIIEYR
jgi:GT2 family glycosyltransferase